MSLLVNGDQDQPVIISGDVAPSPLETFSSSFVDVPSPNDESGQNSPHLPSLGSPTTPLDYLPNPTKFSRTSSHDQVTKKPIIAESDSEKNDDERLEIYAGMDSQTISDESGGFLSASSDIHFDSKNFESGNSYRANQNSTDFMASINDDQLQSGAVQFYSGLGMLNSNTFDSNNSAYPSSDYKETLMPTILSYNRNDTIDNLLLPSSSSPPKKKESSFKVCKYCHENIIGTNYYFVHGSYYHINCLVCNSCNKKLDPENLSLYSDTLYCEECLQNISNRICAACDLPILNQNDAVFVEELNQYYHEGCLTCYLCSAHLTPPEMEGNETPTKPLSLNTDQKPQILTKENNSNISTPVKSNSTKESIETDSILTPTKEPIETPRKEESSKTNLDKVSNPYVVNQGKIMCQKCASKYNKRICKKCGEQITNDLYVFHNQQYFHKHHFCCCICDKVLKGSNYVAHHNKFYCKEHGFPIESSCAFCKRRFVSAEERLLWRNKCYHPDCFVCRTCGAPITKGKARSIHNRPHCIDCFQQRVADGDCDEKGKSTEHRIHDPKETNRRRLEKKENTQTPVKKPTYRPSAYPPLEDPPKSSEVKNIQVPDVEMITEFV